MTYYITKYEFESIIFYFISNKDTITNSFNKYLQLRSINLRYFSRNTPGQVVYLFHLEKFDRSQSH